SIRTFFPCSMRTAIKSSVRAQSCELLALSSGQASRIFGDTRHLGVVDKHLRIGNLGRQWVKDVYSLGRHAPETVAQAASNVPMFQVARAEIPDEQDKKRIAAYFRASSNYRDGRSRDRFCSNALR